MATLTTSYQLIASKYIGDASSSTTKNVYLRIYAKYTSQDIAGNKSNVSYKSTLYVDGGGTYFYTGNYTTKTLSGTGATSVSYDAQGNYYLGETTLCEITGTVAHGSNGEASVSLTAGWKSTPWDINGSLTGTATLPPIARATTPTVSSASVTMGNTINVTISPADCSFKHKIRYEFGTAKSQIKGVKVGGTEITADFISSGAITFTPPTSLSSQIPKANSGICKFLLYTYKSDGTHIGTNSVDLTLSVPSYTPSISSIALTGNNLLSSTYVQGESTVTAKITASSSYNATITSYSSVVDGKTYTGDTFTTSALSNGSKTVVTTIKDSRGKTATLTSSAITVYAYAAPSITKFTLERQTDGTTVIATVTGSVAAINNKNAKTITVTLNGTTKTITSSSYTISGTTTFTGVSTDSTFTGTAKIADSYTSASKDFVLPTVAVTMDFYKDGNGIAMGKVAETGNLLDVNWDARVRKNLQVDGNINGINIRTGNYVFGGSREGITDENWIADVPSFIGTYSQSDKWYSTLSLRHRNGWEDGTSYGLQLRSILTQDDNLSWRQQINGAWKNWRTLLDSTNTADYVVEQGTSGIWTYRKWNSGLAECWGVYTMTSAATKAWGSLFYSDTLAPRINYPFTFMSRPQESAFLHGSSVAGWVYPEAGGIGLNTTTQTGQYGFLRPTTIASSEVKYEYTVVGRWK